MCDSVLEAAQVRKTWSLRVEGSTGHGVAWSLKTSAG